MTNIKEFLGEEDLEFFFLDEINSKIDTAKMDKYLSISEKFNEIFHFYGILTIIRDIKEDKIISVRIPRNGSLKYSTHFSIEESSGKYAVGDILLIIGSHIFKWEVDEKLLEELKEKNLCRKLNLIDLGILHENSSSGEVTSKDIQKLISNISKDIEKFLAINKTIEDTYSNTGKYTSANFNISGNEIISKNLGKIITKNPVNKIFSLVEILELSQYISNINSPLSYYNYYFWDFWSGIVKILIDRKESFKVENIRIKDMGQNVHREATFTLDIDKTKKLIKINGIEVPEEAIKSIMSEMVISDITNESLILLSEVDNFLYRFLNNKKLTIIDTFEAFDNKKAAIIVDILSEKDGKDIKITILGEERKVKWDDIKYIFIDEKSSNIVIRDIINYKTFSEFMDILKIPKSDYLSKLRGIKLIKELK